MFRPWRLVGIASVIAVILFAIYPDFHWHLIRKPWLLDQLDATPVQNLTAESSLPTDFKNTAVHEGMVVTTPHPLALQIDTLQNEYYSVFISKNAPDEDTKTYYREVAWPYLITEEDIRNASTRKDRRNARLAITDRLTQTLNGRTLPRTVVRRSDCKIVYETRQIDKVILLIGVIFNADLSDCRDFLLKLVDGDVEMAKLIVHNLRFADG